MGTHPFDLEVLRTQGLDDLLVGPGGLRHRGAEPIQYVFDRELLHCDRVRVRLPGLSFHRSVAEVCG